MFGFALRSGKTTRPFGHAFGGNQASSSEFQPNGVETGGFLLCREPLPPPPIAEIAGIARGVVCAEKTTAEFRNDGLAGDRCLFTASRVLRRRERERERERDRSSPVRSQRGARRLHSSGGRARPESTLPDLDDAERVLVGVLVERVLRDAEDAAEVDEVLVVRDRTHVRGVELERGVARGALGRAAAAAGVVAELVVAVRAVVAVAARRGGGVVLLPAELVVGEEVVEPERA